MPYHYDAPPVQRFLLSAVDRPSRLREANPELKFVDVAGSLEASRTVAVIGSRDPTQDALEYARRLAADLAFRGVVVVSGGAVGIDQAAHNGAMEVGGRTWAVLASTWPQVTPDRHAALFTDIVASGGTVIWNGTGGKLIPYHFLARNQLLVSLCDAVVVIQARLQSGSRNAAKAARELGRDLWCAAPSPWLDREAYAGNLVEITKYKARPLYDEEDLFASLGLKRQRARNEPSLTSSPPIPERLAPLREDKAELAILRVLHDSGSAVLHIDEIIRQTSLPYGAAASALLTLCLEAVVVEGPGGFYRRRPATLAAMG